MAPVVGIDLGTTHTVVGVVTAGRATTVTDEVGSPLIPSVVSFHPSGRVLAGRAARERRLIDAANTIYSVKRLIGRGWRSEEVARARDRFPFAMREGPGQSALIVAREETFTLPEVSAFVLRHVKALAERRLGSPVEQAVITVPANFNDLQRAATKVAGRVAGLEVLRILNEPTAAALAYGYGKRNAERIAIYDFGGGTFDITILDLASNVFEVLATAGDTFLGGDDIDLAIAERMAEAFLAQYRYDPHEDPHAFEQLRIAAEQLKVALSTSGSASMEIPELAHGPRGRTLGMRFSMSRAELEALAGPIVDRTFGVCEQALEIARLDRHDFNHVVLVGGSTRIPIVRSKVQAFFGRAPLDRVSPDEVVAIGAAIQANALAAGELRRSVIPRPPLPARSGSTAPPPAGGAGGVRAHPGSSPPANPLTGPAPRRRSRPPPLPSRKPPPDPVTGASELPPGAAPHGSTATTGAPASAEDDFGLPVVRSDRPPPVEPGALSMSPEGLPRFREPMDSVSDAPIVLDPTRAAGGPEVGESQRPAATPAAAPQRGLDRPEPPPRPHLPLLVDVTPLSLAVETVSGFCDRIIPRNTPVPCEQSRVFVTARDQQTSVRIRVGQGESERFEENTQLGELELTELRPAPRGSVEVLVTFSLDSDGILSVRAMDRATQQETSAHIRLVGLDPADVDTLTARHAARAGSG